jgi:hypothetical protein
MLILIPKLTPHRLLFWLLRASRDVCGTAEKSGDTRFISKKTHCG